MISLAVYLVGMVVCTFGKHIFVDDISEFLWDDGEEWAVRLCHDVVLFNAPS